MSAHCHIPRYILPVYTIQCEHERPKFDDIEQTEIVHNESMNSMSYTYHLQIENTEHSTLFLLLLLFVSVSVYVCVCGTVRFDIPLLEQYYCTRVNKRTTRSTTDTTNTIHINTIFVFV